MPLVGQVGQVVTPLDAALQVEAAQTVADQEKSEGHGAGSGRGHRMGQAIPGDNRLQLS